MSEDEEAPTLDEREEEEEESGFQPHHLLALGAVAVGAFWIWLFSAERSDTGGSRRFDGGVVRPVAASESEHVGTGPSTGVGECDAYLAGLRRCMVKGGAGTDVEGVLRQQREAFLKAAESTEGKAALRAACSQGFEALKNSNCN